jgi:hypothetical protein
MCTPRVLDIRKENGYPAADRDTVHTVRQVRFENRHHLECHAESFGEQSCGDYRCAALPGPVTGKEDRTTATRGGAWVCAARRGRGVRRGHGLESSRHLTLDR